jgi:hypothetical protein
MFLAHANYLLCQPRSWVKLLISWHLFDQKNVIQALMALQSRLVVDLLHQVVWQAFELIIEEVHEQRRLHEWIKPLLQLAQVVLVDLQKIFV